MPNQLAGETSPYLLQHMDNPVHWQPWSDEVFGQAAREDKPVFLSVGYSTCHWCHVMAHESFECEQVAEVLNHHFICVKVDREELPDIDALYMNYLQVTSGHGGWPMSIWLSPEGIPIFGGTYFPPDDRQGRPGFKRICRELARLWRDDRGHLLSEANKVMEHMRQQSEPQPADGSPPESTAIDHFLQTCRNMHDEQLGGFGGAPKFPRPVLLRTLIQLASHQQPSTPMASDAWQMADATLNAMAKGGIHDQLAGGFHRYSVDRYWHVPHYEKMLYDQAQIAMAYLDAWEIDGDAGKRQVIDGIFTYLLECMRDAKGGLHAAEDADSLPSKQAKHAVEGAFWTWPADEISQLLPPRDAAIFNAAYGVEADGNARPESDPHGELAGRNTLYRSKTTKQLAETFDCDPAALEQTLASARQTLLQARLKRPQPHRDDKIITAWNGLAIAALARGGRLLDRPDLTQAGSDIATFLQSHLWSEGHLYRSFRKHRGNARGVPADFVYLIHGLLELNTSLPGMGWLDWAIELQSTLDNTFWDDAHHGYVMRPMIAGRSLLAMRDDYDGAEPSPNHLAIPNLWQLAQLTGEAAYRQKADALLSAGSRTSKHPFACPVLISALICHQQSQR